MENEVDECVFAPDTHLWVSDQQPAGEGKRNVSGSGYSENSVLFNWKGTSVYQEVIVHLLKDFRKQNQATQFNNEQSNRAISNRH